MKPFVGREIELQRLEDLSQSGRACLAVIKGRRRIGKSRLAEEFGKNKEFLSFSGLAPVKGVTAQDQRDSFTRQLATLFHLPLSLALTGAALLTTSQGIFRKNRPLFFLMKFPGWVQKIPHSPLS